MFAFFRGKQAFPVSCELRITKPNFELNIYYFRKVDKFGG